MHVKTYIHTNKFAHTWVFPLRFKLEKIALFSFWFFSSEKFEPLLRAVLKDYSKQVVDRDFSEAEHLLSPACKRQFGRDEISERNFRTLREIPAWRRRGHSLTACNAAPPIKSKMPARGPQNGRRGLEWCLPPGSKQLSLNKFFDPSTPSMRKGRDGRTGEKKKIRMKIVATTSLPAVDRPLDT